MKIAIVDDERLELERTEEYLRRLLAGHFPEIAKAYQIDLFAEPREFLEEFSKGAYSLAILDICMPKLTGIDAARHIRSMDENAGLIFLTTSEEYMLEGYRVFADGYFLKPLRPEDEGAFVEAMERVFRRMVRSGAQISVELDGAVMAEVPLDKIISCEVRSDRRVHLTLVDGERKLAPSWTYEKLAGLLLGNPAFIECYHRVIINMDKVEDMQEEDMVLEGGVHCPISKRKKSEVKKTYMKYLLER